MATFWHFHVKVDRSRKKECAVKVKVQKDFTFRDDIYNLVDKCCESGLVPDVALPNKGPKVKRVTKGKVKQDKFV